MIAFQKDHAYSLLVASKSILELHTADWVYLKAS